MSDPTGDSVQGHLTIGFLMKSSADCASAREKITTLVPNLYRAADAMGTLHYCRFIELDNTVYLLADFDGDMETVVEDLAKHLGPILDPVLAHVSDAPPTPVANNVKAFTQWAADHNITEFADYVCYPGTTVKKIKSLASAAGITIDRANMQEIPLLVIMQMKGRLSSLTVAGVLKILRGYLNSGADAVGTVHFAHIVGFPNNQIGFFTIYDGPFSKYVQDFADKLGPAFDLMFKFIIDPTPTPVSKNVQPFTKWTQENDLKPLAFYSGYPGLRVPDVRALLADAS